MKDSWSEFHDRIGVPILVFKVDKDKISHSKKNSIKKSFIYNLECVHCNLSASKKVKIVQSDVVGKSLDKLIPDIYHNLEMRKAIRAVIKKAIKGKVFHRNIYYHNVETDNARFDAVYTCGDDMIVLTCGDVDKVLKENERLSEELEKVEKINEVQHGFMANMSHEIRTPLNGIIGMASILRDTNLNREQQEALEVLLHSCYNLMAIVNDILDVSKLDAGAIKLRKKHMSIQDCVESSYEVLRPHSAEKDLDFTYYIDDDVPEFIVEDFQRLRQVLVNLLSNAVKFTEEGRVCTSVELEYKRKNTYYIKFSVEDTGIGISEHDQRKLFKNFGKLRHKSRIYPGTGLGLAISQNLVDLMGGRILIDSEIGKGSKFYFTIPVKKSNISVDKLKVEDLVGKQALVVDDNPTNLRYVCDILDKWGIEHRESSSGKQALISYVNNNKYYFDFGLIDICMPDMDGNRLAEKIKQSRRGNFPLIALSSQDEKIFDVCSAFDEHIPKPYTEKQLIDAILRVVSLNKPRDLNSTISCSKSRKFSHPNINKSKLSIAIAEDNDFNQRVITTMLKKAGFKKPDVYPNGKELIHGISDKLKTDTYYDIVLMDIKMPIMDGIEASKKIHEIISKENLPKIIAVTAAALPDQKKTFMKADQFDGYITKPIEDTGILVDAISKSMLKK